MTDYGKECNDLYPKIHDAADRKAGIKRVHILEDITGRILYNGSKIKEMNEIMLRNQGEYKSYSFARTNGDYIEIKTNKWAVVNDDGFNKIFDYEPAVVNLCRKEVIDSLKKLLERDSTQTDNQQLKGGIE
jgi:hypothetical protein